MNGHVFGVYYAIEYQPREGAQWRRHKEEHPTEELGRKALEWFKATNPGIPCRLERIDLRPGGRVETLP